MWGSRSLSDTRYNEVNYSPPPPLSSASAKSKKKKAWPSSSMPSLPTAKDRAERGAAKGGEADEDEKEMEGKDGAGGGGEDKGKEKYDGEWIC
jgi:hypothetical protein